MIAKVSILKTFCSQGRFT